MTNRESDRESGQDESPKPPARKPGRTPGLDAVEARLRELQKGKQRDVRWTMSKHTAEMAISAFVEDPAPARPAKSSKNRRRKKGKRLL